MYGSYNRHLILIKVRDADDVDFNVLLFDDFSVDDVHSALTLVLSIVSSLF